MISDDSKYVQNILQDVIVTGMLEGEHTVVATSSDGDETLQRYEDVRPDLLLLDLAMPKMDGYHVLQNILITHPDSKIIVMSASSDEKMSNKCMNAGAKGFISKPFEIEELSRVVSDVLSVK